MKEVFGFCKATSTYAELYEGSCTHNGFTEEDSEWLPQNKDERHCDDFPPSSICKQCEKKIVCKCATSSIAPDYLLEGEVMLARNH
jgi:hypothetical protein